MQFEFKLVSKNVRDKWHWSKRLTQRKMLTKLIALRYPLKTGTPDHKQRVTVTRYLKRREREWDTANGYGGNLIEVVDSLVHVGYLKDDSPKWCEVVFLQDDSQRHSVPCFKVVLEPVVLREVAS